VRWDYDPTTGGYLRYVDTQEDSDGEAYMHQSTVKITSPSPLRMVVAYVVHDDYLKNGRHNIVDIY
jgi:hypothetical protein